jgi:hypothetical protein
MSFAYHPQMDGQTERINQCLEMHLRCSIASTLKQWVKWLPLAELWYNSSYHTALKCSPFKVLYVVDPFLGVCPEVIPPDNQDVAATLEERKHFSEMLKQNLARAQNRMKLEAVSKCTNRQFQVGEQVLLKLQHHVHSSTLAHSEYWKELVQ